MPRKRTVDPLVTVLEFFEQQPQEICEVASRIVLRTVRQRFPPLSPPVKVRRTQKTSVIPVALPPIQESTEQPVPPTQTVSRRKKRLRADSPKPPNEATPIVPLQEQVGEDETYTGD